jgi:hypothetical protein
MMKFDFVCSDSRWRIKSDNVFLDVWDHTGKHVLVTHSQGLDPTPHLLEQLREYTEAAYKRGIEAGKEARSTEIKDLLNVR